MDHVLSPSFNIPSIGTPHHAMDEDQMINPSAQALQQSQSSQNTLSRPPQYSFGGDFSTPQNLLSTGATPQNLLASPAPGLASQHSSSATPAGVGGSATLSSAVSGGGTSSGGGGGHVYAPCASPAPPSPSTPLSSAAAMAPPHSMDQGIVPQLQVTE
jgi:hypothetical protein